MADIIGRSRKGRAGLAAVALSALLAGCDSGEDQAAAREAPPPAVVVAPVVTREVNRTVEFVGRTEAFRQVDLRARVTGFLLDRPFKEGEDIAAGDLLFVVDDAEYKAAVDAAAAELQRARATYQAAASELERAQTLIQRGNISESTLDQRTADEARSKAEINAAEAALQRTRLDLDYTKITAPFAGRIGRATYDIGNLVGPDSGVLATLVDLDPIYVTFPVSERDLLTAMQARRTVDGVQSSVVPRLRLSTGDMYDHDGRIEFLDNRVDPTTGTVAVRAQFANPDQLLLPGQFVTVVLSAGTAETRAVIPQAAVQENQAGRFVLVVGDDDRVDARQVVAGQRLGTDWVIEDGLEEGELVVVEGLQKVRPGARVRPVRAGEAG